MDEPIVGDDVAKVDVGVGRIIAVDEFPETRRPAWKLRIDWADVACRG
ncbi:MAG TPA: hypothetical protein VGZ52_04815 [Acidimicrobiales bacterium]|jgi:tRNA-binding protein|nr:hypothetical protein [Acidimicrobiales bacterium]